MKDKRLFSQDRPARALAFAMALFLAGCGGGTSSPTGTNGDTTAKDSSPPAAASQKSSPKGNLKGISPGGDMGVRERRNQKLKERAAAKG